MCKAGAGFSLRSGTLGAPHPYRRSRRSKHRPHSSDGFAAHGWVHDKAGTRRSIAADHVGVNSNILGPGDLFDPVSKNTVVNGIPVRVETPG